MTGLVLSVRNATVIMNLAGAKTMRFHCYNAIYGSRNNERCIQSRPDGHSNLQLT
jgi:hypothetical protein